MDDNATALIEDPELLTLLEIDPITVEIGRDLLSLAQLEHGAPLIDRVKAIRRHIATARGIIIPQVHVRDSQLLPGSSYALKIRDIEVATGAVRLGKLLVIGPEAKLESLQGESMADPTFGMPGLWVGPEQRAKAEGLGCTIFDVVALIATQLTAVIRAHAADLFTFSLAAALLEQERHARVMSELSSRGLTMVKVWRILRILLAEQVSIRDLPLILQTLLEHCDLTADEDLLTEFVRLALRAYICREIIQEGGKLEACLLSHEQEKPMRQAMSGQQIVDFLAFVHSVVDQQQQKGLLPVLVTSPDLRRKLRDLTVRDFPGLWVLSQAELAPYAKLRAVRLVKDTGVSP